jgi:hypothetical protein
MVLIGDMKASKEIPNEDRNFVQDQLKAVLSEIEAQTEDYISPPTLTLGDEFQIVYSHATALFKHIWAIQAAMAPVSLRFGIGVGTISTSLNYEQALGMDGPVFHAARKAIEELKECDQRFRLEGEGIDTTALDLINHSLALLDHEVNGWRDRRLKVLSLMKSGYDYKYISNKMGISAKAFYKNVEAGALEIIISLGDSICKMLNEKYLK